VQRYTATTYGDAFADVYDDWYGVDGVGGDGNTAATVDLVERVARRSRARHARVLELGAGTGRLAVPLAARGLDVVAVDSSTAMLDRLRARDQDETIRIVTGDMVDDMPAGPFDAVFVADNTLFNLDDAGRQRACFSAVAQRLASKGSFLVEAFVPNDPPAGSAVTVRSMTADEVVLSVTVHEPADQRAAGHYVHLADGQPVRLRPWAIRYATPAQLDAMAAAAGLILLDRWSDAAGAPFSSSNERHVSRYGRTS